jgi:ATP-dependent RNA helicase RhlE
MHVSAAVIVGGVKPGPQIKACARGLDIIIATPGRLLDHLNSGAVRLDHTFQVIADEADHMMDMGFLPSIRKIMQALPKKRQTVLLSATMPGQIRNLAKDFMTNPVEISVTPVSKPIERITQIIKRVEKAEKKRTLVNILSESDIGQTVVFTRTKHGANKVSDYLVKAGLSALAIHGNKSQSQRAKSLASFKAGTTKVLVATDIAARGIDIDDVSHVVNFELPNVPESYVHRIGRTARAGRSGVAISLCDTSEIKLLRDIEKLTGQNLLKGEPQSDRGGESRQPANNRGGNKQRQRSRKHKRTNGQQQQAAPAQRRNKQAANHTDGDSAGGTNTAHKNNNRKNNVQKNTNRKNNGAPGADKPTDGLRRVLGDMPSNTKRRAA